MNPKPASRRGGKPSGSVPIFPWVPAAIFFSASSGLVWLLFTLAVKPGQPIWDTPPASWMVLRVYHFDLRSLFTHHFLHLHWIHLTLNVMAILYAGRVLEVRWGSLRFSGFY